MQNSAYNLIILVLDVILQRVGNKNNIVKIKYYCSDLANDAP